MKVFGSMVVTGLAVATLACGGGNQGAESRDMTMNDSAAEQHGNQPDMAAQTRTSLTGCLLPGGDAGTFVLQLASAGDSSNTAGSPPATGSAWAPGATYNVRAATNDDLSQHLNTMVEIEGTVDMGTSGSIGTAGAAGSAGAPPADARGDRSGTLGSTANRDDMGNDLPTMRAESIRQVADQCSSPGRAQQQERR